MANMTVGQLIELLSDFGDHLEVMVSLPGGNRKIEYVDDETTSDDVTVLIGVD